MKEEWREIPQYNGRYQVSNFGRIKSMSRVVSNGRKLITLPERILKQNPNKDGYMMVGLSIDNYQYPHRVHCLVAQCFLGHDSKNSNLVVDHIDENILNNHLENLQLLTNRQNVIKSHKKRRDLPTGVYRKRKKYFSQIYVNGAVKRLGTFETIEEASKAYQKELALVS